ncbi:glycoside hydrolase family 43 protein [Tilletiaria anomala UBC 951]|uniref:Glycoside hydrolase family 43 protein n=1 Tax=Tilletiaria anomala (strain ATCC 24038 / CBS 436.72 / UBC 951) TaxID=1037660 RepID=A0A066WG61_TILAU|nr:glycoside hydrolase family 43 protein [Tilletiaria anomala UBC 951]KDN52952.1 glycoside hydrolase family 43 protein [Tilletiaria anomala UBC 951]
MDDLQLRPRKSRKVGKFAPRGIYIPSIDPNVYLDNDNIKIYLYLSRNAYQNWKAQLLGGELKAGWWHNPTANALMEIVDKMKNANLANVPAVPANMSTYSGNGEIHEPPHKE